MNWTGLVKHGRGLIKQGVIKHGLTLGRTRGRGWGGGGWMPPPHEVFLSFFPGGLGFSEAVRSSLTQILRQV